MYVYIISVQNRKMETNNIYGIYDSCCTNNLIIKSKKSHDIISKVDSFCKEEFLQNDKWVFTHVVFKLKNIDLNFDDIKIDTVGMISNKIVHVWYWESWMTKIMSYINY